MQLRYLSALQEIANDRTNTIVFPMPLDGIGDILPKILGKGGTDSSGG